MQYAAVRWAALACLGLLPACRDGAEPTAVVVPASPNFQSAQPRTLVLVGEPDAMMRQRRPLVPQWPDASPGGWLYGDSNLSSLVGNNVEVVRDADGYRPLVRDWDFDFPFSNAYAQGEDPNIDSDAVLSQIFYWINVGHDYAWLHGFDEQAGSWQDDRFGRGGPQRHRLVVRAQAKLSNALYVGDGVIVMGLIPYPTGPRRDTGLDVEELLHEYFHALFESAVAAVAYSDPSRSLASPVNESMADYFGASITGDPLFGEYMSRNAETGLDHHRLDANPQTFADYACGEPHLTGEVWSATLWDIRQALGQDAADDRIIRGLTLVRSPVTFLTMRDAIVRADSVLGGRYQDALWQIFAARGFGWTALLRSCTDMRVSYDVPIALRYRVGAAVVDRRLPLSTDTSIVVSVQNTGTATWSATGPAAVALSYQWVDSTGDTVVAHGLETPLPSDVASRAEVTTTARVRTPDAPGAYNLRWGLVRAGGDWISPPKGSQRVWVADVPALLARWVADDSPDTLVVGDTIPVHIRVINDGSATWSAAGLNPVFLAYHWLNSSGSMVVFDGLRAGLTSDVAPGDTATFTARLPAPPTRYGSFQVEWDLVQDGVAWFGWRGSPTLSRSLWVAPRFAVKWIGVDTAATQLPAGDTGMVTVRFRNTGRDTIGPGHQPASVSYHWSNSQGSAVVYDGLHTAIPIVVAPGETAAVLARVAGPPRLGDFVLSLDLLQEGVAWYSWAGLPTFDIPVAGPRNRVRWDSLPEPRWVLQGANVTEGLSFTNVGGFVWHQSGASTVRLGYRWRSSDGTRLPWVAASPLSRDVAPGESVRIEVAIRAPMREGSWYLDWDLLQDDQGWLSWFGSSTGISFVHVGPRRSSD